VSKTRKDREIDLPREPLPGQLEFPAFRPQPPPTRWMRFRIAWNEGKLAALAGKSLDDCPLPGQIARRGYGQSKAAIRAHLRYARQWQRFWRDGFESVGLFPESRLP
jgi:hypothetical protein